MKISGIGIDIEEVSRFEEREISENRSFYEKIFTEEEINYCLEKNNPYPHFTARFCAKEAFVKAIGDSSIIFTDIEIKKKNNKPIIQFKNQDKGMVSISHTSKYAIAFVIIEEN